MAKDKTNIEFLHDILEELELSDPVKAAEGKEFLEAIQEDQRDLESQVKQLEQDAAIEDDDEDDEPKYGNEDFVGLDTIYWGLKEGNLKIQMQMETFITTMKKVNCATIV